MADPKTGRVAKRSSSRLRGRGMLTEAIRAQRERKDTAAEENAVNFSGSGTKAMTTQGACEDEEVPTTQAVGAALFGDTEHSEVELKPRVKGKGRAVEPEVRPFDFMELPAELRLEIYRACLTRPDKILLSKKTEPVLAPTEEESDEDACMVSDEANEMTREEYQTAIAAMNRRRANRGLPARNASNSGLLRNLLRLGQRSGQAVQLPAPGTSRRRHTGTHSTLRLTPSTSAPPNLASSSSSVTNGHVISHGQHFVGSVGSIPNPHRARREANKAITPVTITPKSGDPLIVNILRTNKTVYKEARSLLYSENHFNLSIYTAIPSLAALHQRSRRLIRHIELEIPSYTEIQDKFSEVVRLSLRYCSGLRKLVIHTPFCLPGSDGTSTPNSQIWAQGFDILRWLPQQCDVELRGTKNVEIEEVVGKHLMLARTLSPVAYAHRQLIPSDSDRAAAQVRGI